ncbi:fungal-specific transcription factor domain-containing protein [Lipomyces orientalis]|uniref:Fungal-specific transcription factor domain-containing protein n=1 Tax=Lipomyces orientalis TaxID=1233043 RepID=A0ACC3TEB0_9ASCO
MDSHSMYAPCYTCRRRRIRCDQSHIPCAKCEKSGFECFQQRPLRWVKGTTLRSKFQSPVLSKSLIEVSDSVATKSFGCSNGNVTGVNEPSSRYSGMPYSDTDRIDDIDTPTNPALILPQVLQDQAISHLNRTSRYYLDYYNDRICKLFIVHDSDRNPLRNLISLALSDSVLLNAVLTLAARHLANTGRSFSLSRTATTYPQLLNASQDALSYKYKAIQGLSCAVYDTTLSRQDTSLASIFLLIFLDLLESGSDRWNVHLEGATSWITSNKRHLESPAGTTQYEIRHFITSQLYLMGTLGGTFVRPKLLTQFTQLQQFDMPLQDIVEQSFLGCPGYLLHAIQYLSFQRDAIVDAEPIDDATICKQVEDITATMDSVQKFDCYGWAVSLPRRHQSSPEDIKNLCALAFAYKLGATIYGRRVLDASTGDVSSQDDLVCELIGVIGSLQDDNALFKCILWPMFVAGLECRWQAHRKFLVECMEKFWGLTLCLNVINAADILNEYWQRVDRQNQLSSQWIFDIGRLGQDWLLI